MQTNLEKGEQSWRAHTSQFGTSQKGIVIKTVEFAKDRHRDHWNRIENAEINICLQATDYGKRQDH